MDFCVRRSSGAPADRESRAETERANAVGRHSDAVLFWGKRRKGSAREETALRTECGGRFSVSQFLGAVCRLSPLPFEPAAV